ncbi:hypothetical protein NLU13_0775 [Sarocladium strictum]|uniref:Zn(2)-C6 fungal-type domain-containing protein n=1 Tax=Sarocladium strictum TaxID=5046 RepID=A0AA39GQF8_SARSR|nr:hypothetical protein NLU13_0775 [Sarocladium strictum]
MAARPSDVPETPPTAKKRRRPALACTQCRRRKIRCDQNTPCNNCIKSGIPDCTIPPNHISTLRLQQSQASTSRPAVATISPPSAPGSTVLTPRPTPVSVHTDDVNVDELHSRIKELENTIFTLRQGDGERQRPATVGVPSDPRSAGARFGNQSSWLNNTTLYTKVLSTLKDLRDQRSELKQSMRVCQNLLSRVNEQMTTDMTSPISAFGTQMPNKIVADELLNLYLRSFEGVLRILHVPSFLAEYERYWQQPAEARKLFVLQLQLCLGLGSRTHPEAVHFRRIASQWLFEAETWLGTAFRKSQRKQMTFEDLQLMCLATIMEADSSGSEKSNWISAGDLLRMAMCLNLQHDPVQLGTTNLRQAELHRRLWVTILELNLLFSLQAGQTPLIMTQDYDTLPPANISDEALDEADPNGNRNPTTGLTRTAVQIALYESFELRLRIVRQIHGAGRSCPYDETIRLHKELSKAEARASHKLFHSSSSCSNGEGRNVDVHVQRLLVQTTISYYLLALHLPVLGHSIKDPTHHFSRKVATTVAARIAEACVVCDPDRRSLSTARQAQDGSLLLNRLFTNSPGFLRHIAVQAIFYLALELVTMKEDEEDDVGMFFLREELDLLHLLEQAQAWILERVRRGMKDVYTCCFVAASVSYAQNLGLRADGNASLDDAIAAKAVEKSEECRMVLEDLARSLGAAGNEQVMVPDPNLGFTGQALGSVDVSMDWMTDMVMDGTNYYDWSFQGGPGNMPQILL